MTPHTSSTLLRGLHQRLAARQAPGRNHAPAEFQPRRPRQGDGRQLEGAVADHERPERLAKPISVRCPATAPMTSPL
jgi:hypothetical protein